MKNLPDPEIPPLFPVDVVDDLVPDPDEPTPYMWDLYDEKVYKDTGKLVLLPEMLV